MSKTANTMSFNRYMVECESNKSSWKSVVWWSFNRYMVECEFK